MTAQGGPQCILSNETASLHAGANLMEFAYALQSSVEGYVWQAQALNIPHGSACDCMALLCAAKDIFNDNR